LPEIDLNVSEKNSSKKLNLVYKKNNEVKKEQSNILITSEKLPSFENCLVLAKRYLKEGNYEKALQWAKYANIQDKKAVEPWIITAKALFYLGKKDEALKVLKIYNYYYKNKNVEKLIEEFNKN